MAYRDPFVDEIIERLLTEASSAVPPIPDDLERSYQREAGWVCAMAGAGTGAMMGAHIGIAGGPLGAIAGTIPGAIIGGMMGFFGGQKVGSKLDADPPVSNRGERLGHITRSCPGCCRNLLLPVDKAGSVKCPGCGMVFRPRH
ncbi:MAG TPA: hypothetical protein VHD76_22835 [Bryobacteraceae bacterium]|jgi:hypothetical protein|nr:hypothetical protein [Bryobacteraceae bacterium]